MASLPATAREWAGAAARAVVRDEAVNRLTPTSPHQQATEALGRITGAHLFSSSLTLLVAIRAPLVLFIAARGSSGLLSPGSSGTVPMRFHGNESSPAADLFVSLSPRLEACGLNGFGVLSAMARVFAEYGSFAGQGSDRTYRLNIEVTAT